MHQSITSVWAAASLNVWRRILQFLGLLEPVRLYCCLKYKQRCKSERIAPKVLALVAHMTRLLSPLTEGGLQEPHHLGIERLMEQSAIEAGRINADLRCSGGEARCAGREEAIMAAVGYDVILRWPRQSTTYRFVVPGIRLVPVVSRVPELDWYVHVLQTVGAESEAERWGGDDNRLDSRIRDPGPRRGIGPKMGINAGLPESPAEIMVRVRLTI